MHGGVLVDDGGGGAQAGEVHGGLDYLVDGVDVLECEDELLEPEHDEAAGGDGDELHLWSNHPAHGGQVHHLTALGEEVGGEAGQWGGQVEEAVGGRGSGSWSCGDPSAWLPGRLSPWQRR